MKKKIFIINVFFLLIVLFSNVNFAVTAEGLRQYSDDYDSTSTISKYQEENIRDYDVEIELNEDATMDVTENITVYAAGNEIKHGIYRDFPTKYNNKVVTFDVKSVLLDGKDVKYSLESINRGVRIKIGSESTLVSNGLHTYTIKYNTERQIAFEDDYDELYWNVIGSGWNFSIDHCHARVYLPKNSKIIEKKLKAYTGPYGKKGQSDSVYTYCSDNYIDYEIYEKLDTNEAFTISVCLEKGALIEPSFAQKTKWFVTDNIISLIIIGSLLLLVIVQFIIWKKHGKDPTPNVIIPKYFPPEGMAPSDVKYVSTMGKMDKILEATIISLAVKGYMKFSKEHEKVMFEKTVETQNLEELNDIEQDVYRTLPQKQVIEYSLFFQTTLSTLKNVIENKLKSKYQDKMFFKNTKYVFMSIIFTVISIIIAILAGSFINGFAALEYFQSLLIAVPISLVTAVIIAEVIRILKIKSSGVFKLITCLVSIFPLAIFLISAVFMIKSTITITVMSILVFIVAIIDNVTFMKLVRRYTEEGLRIKEDIEGFRMFINTAKDDDFKDKTPEMFDKYFPYAYVLGLENKWAEKFEDTLKIADYSPSWCSSNMLDNGTFNAVMFTNSFSSSFSSGMSAASTAPSSSGGSDGGGFSGGGGGGRRWRRPEWEVDK